LRYYYICVKSRVLDETLFAFSSAIWKYFENLERELSLAEVTLSSLASTNVDKFIFTPSHFQADYMRRRKGTTSLVRHGFSLPFLSISGILPLRENVSAAAAYPANNSHRKDSRSVIRIVNVTFIVIEFVSKCDVSALNS